MESEEKQPKQHGMLLVIAGGLAQFIVCADYFAVAVALPPMAKDLGVRAIDLQWVITGYILTFCAVLAIAGPLGDRYGRKKLLLLGVVLFALISVWVGLSDSAGMVIAARIALGVAGGLLFPLAIAVVSFASSKARLARNIAILSGVTMLGSAVGPVLGGVLADTLGWRWIFFANVPVCAVAFLMVLFVARESRDEAVSGRLDVGGIVLLLLAIGAISVGIDRIPAWSMLHWVLLLGGGVVLLIAFIALELYLKSPIIDLRLFGNRVFTGNALTGLLSNSAWCMLVFIVTLQMQKVLHFGVLKAGLFFLFLSSTVGLASFTAPIFERRIGTVMLLRIGLVFQVVGLFLLFIVDSPVGLAIGLSIAGVGCSLGWTMPQAGAIHKLPHEKAGLASSSILTVMILSGNTAIVVVAMLIDLYPNDVAGEAAGIRLSFLIAACSAALALFCAWVLLRSSDSPRSDESESEELAAA